MKWLISGWVVVAVSMAGCGGGATDAPKIAPAGGVVKFKGEPVADSIITFYPDAGPAGVGRTDAQGAFQMKTNGALGVAIGKHHVTVSGAQATGEAPPMDGKEMEYAAKSKYSAKYADAKTTDLVIDIPAAGNSALTLDLTE